MKSFLWLLPLAWPFTVVAGQDLSLTAAGRIEHGPLKEVSGIVKSRSRPDVYWVHNDSGNSARLFAINGEGRTIIPTFSQFSYYGETPQEGKEEWPGFRVLFTDNRDWEDMTIDANFLYLADTGNNLNMRRDLGIYVLGEIDPTASTQSAAIKHLPVRYPEQTGFPGLKWHYDSESLFSADGHLYLITKHRRFATLNSYKPGASLYRLDTDYTERDNLLTLVDENADLTGASGAELSPDGQRLAVVSEEALWLFDRPASGDRWLSSSRTRIGLDRRSTRQVEAVTWEDDSTVLLVNEERDMFRLRVPYAGKAHGGAD